MTDNKILYLAAEGIKLCEKYGVTKDGKFTAEFYNLWNKHIPAHGFNRSLRMAVVIHCGPEIGQTELSMVATGVTALCFDTSVGDKIEKELVKEKMPEAEATGRLNRMYQEFSGK